VIYPLNLIRIFLRPLHQKRRKINIDVPSQQWDGTFKPISTLYHATRGSAALDIPSSQNTYLQPALGRYKLHTGICGPLTEKTIGLVLGRSSMTMAGLTVFPGIIDSYYNGEILIMAQVDKPLQILKDQSIAQLLILPYVKGRTLNTARNGGFGSTGKNVYLKMLLDSNRPQIMLLINDIYFQGLLDTGADVSIISLDQWPSQWPMTKIKGTFSGTGQITDIW
jgi:dUTPase